MAIPTEPIPTAADLSGEDLTATGFTGAGLTAGGCARREEMLTELVGAMRTLHRRRRIRRRVLAGSLLTLAAALLVPLATSQSSRSPAARDSARGSEPPGPAPVLPAVHAAVEPSVQPAGMPQIQPSVQPPHPVPISSTSTELPAATEQAPPRAVEFAVVQTDPHALARCAADPPLVVDFEYLGDRALIDTLAAIGRPAGLVTLDDRAWLTAPVTDDALAAVARPPQAR